jgi:type VI secretion system secreted protein VgrG
MSTTQAHRDLALMTPLGSDVLLVQSMVGTESISAPFRFELFMISERSSPAIDSLVGQKVTLQLALPSGNRHYNGYVRQIGKMTSAHGREQYYAEVVPWLWHLSQNCNCRIFQDKSVPDIIKAIFSDRGFSGDVQYRLRENYQPRDYCIQYRETDLEFISRLMEEEGIFYFFEHSTDNHKMIVGDTSDAFQACPGQSSARFHGGAPANEEDVVFTFRKEHLFVPGKYTVSDYHFETPSDLVTSTSPSVVTVRGNTGLEMYEYPGYYARPRFDAGDTGKLMEEARRVSKLRMQSLESQHLTVYGTSGCRAFLPGYTFDLTEHGDGSMNGEYILTMVRHEATSNVPDSGETTYSNSFAAIPAAVSYRPARVTPRPVVQGSQTALVVGPPGEEIYTDKFGRVKVQFHWDREGTKDENSSCWLRVAQPWSGKQWGAHFWPRIGHEVLVDFLEGDPDRPLIVASIYNGENMPPYTMPDNQTRTGIKTRSSPNGDPEKFNEIRFEDKTGEEEIYIHAEKDFNRVVENNETIKVGFDKQDDGNQTIEIFNNQELTIGDPKCSDGSQTIQIWKDRNVTLKQGSDTLTIQLGDQTTDVQAGQSSTTALQSIELKVGSNSIKIDQMGITIKGLKISIEASAMAKMEAPMTTVTGSAVMAVGGGLIKIG